MAKYVDADELFTLTKQGLDFYDNFFAMPYPFHKCGVAACAWCVVRAF
jgi:aminopeptidase N